MLNVCSDEFHDNWTFTFQETRNHNKRHKRASQQIRPISQYLLADVINSMQYHTLITWSPTLSTRVVIASALVLMLLQYVDLVILPWSSTLHRYQGRPQSLYSPP